MSEDLSAEDAKLVTLARGARGRIGAVSGAALRDETGRTYAAADVALASLALSALEVVVAQAVSEGSRGVEAAVVVTDSPAPLDCRAVAELGGDDVPVLVCAPDGSVVRLLRAGQPE